MTMVLGSEVNELNHQETHAPTLTLDFHFSFLHSYNTFFSSFSHNSFELNRKYLILIHLQKNFLGVKLNFEKISKIPQYSITFITFFPPLEQHHLKLIAEVLLSSFRDLLI
jgi:hypothetical protein